MDLNQISTATTVFQNKFGKPTHKYPTNFFISNFSSIPPFGLKMSKYKISVRGTKLWKKVPTNSEKMQERVTALNSIRNLKMRWCISKSNCLNRWNTSSSSLHKGDLWDGRPETLCAFWWESTVEIVRQTVSGRPDFGFHSECFWKYLREFVSRTLF